MTKIHAARQLLALGPLSFREFYEITGWEFSTCRQVLSKLVDGKGEVLRLGRRYWLTNGKELRDLPELAAQEIRRDGEAQAMPVHVASRMGVPAAVVELREAQAGCAGCGKCACGVGQQKVSA